MPIKRLGILSGRGELPRIIAREAKKKGYSVIAIIPSLIENDSFEDIADASYRINLGRLGHLISILKGSMIGHLVMVGGFPKTLLYNQKKKVSLDERAIRLLHSLKDQSDDSIMDAIVEEIEREGVRVVGISPFVKGLMAVEGPLTREKPSHEDWMDIRFGWRIGRITGRLGIGQTVVVKNRAVMAIEAIEGTDEAIRRGGMLGGGDTVVVKLKRPHQDTRYDLPVVGIETLRVMNLVKAKVLAIEARKTIILHKDDFIRTANEMGISVVGVSQKVLQGI